MKAFLLVASVWSLAGCPSKDSPPAPRETASAPPPATAAACAAPRPSASPPYKNAPDVPGPAFLGIRGAGTYQLDEGKLTNVDAHDEPLGQQLLVGDDGVVYIGAGKTLRSGKLGGLPIGSPYRLATAKDGTLWGLDPRGEVSHLDTSVTPPDWKMDPAIQAKAFTLQHIAVDASGKPVVASMDAVYTRSGDGWKSTGVKEVVGDNPASIYGLVRRGDEVVVVTNYGVAPLGGKPYPVDGTMLFFATQSFRDGFASGSAAGEAAIGSTSGLIVLDKQGKATSKAIETAVPKAKQVSAFAVDGQGRWWVGADGGLFVLSREGKLLHRWDPGSLPGVVDRIAVVGAGPALPAAEETVVKGTVTLKVTLDGGPLPKVEVAVCPHPTSVFSGITPCDGQLVVVKGTSDAQGLVTLKDVPRVEMQFAAKNGTSWYLTGPSKGCCTQVEAGKEVDVGEIAYRNQ